jgi:hypothetical protein
VPCSGAAVPDSQPAGVPCSGAAVPDSQPAGVPGAGAAVLTVSQEEGQPSHMTSRVR